MHRQPVVCSTPTTQQIPAAAAFAQEESSEIEACGGPAIAETYRCPATATRFCFVAHAGARRQLLLRLPRDHKQQREREQSRRSRSRAFVEVVMAVWPPAGR
jgi:hypothetical protein